MKDTARRLPKMDYNARNSVEEAQDEWVVNRQWSGRRTPGVNLLSKATVLTKFTNEIALPNRTMPG